jgi:hypothetical protein
MAGPITHIVLTDKIFDKYLNKFSKIDFLMGSCFSDIRYLKVLDRDSTHDDLVEPDELLGNNSFMAGVEFHALIDKVREDFLLTKKNYAPLLQIPVVCWMMNFFEDEVLYEKFNGWPELTEAFKLIPYQQIKFDLDKKTIDGWYALLREYFAVCSSQTRESLLVKNGFSARFAAEVNEFIDDLKNKHRHREVVLELYDKIEDLVADYFNR